MSISLYFIVVELIWQQFDEPLIAHNHGKNSPSDLFYSASVACHNTEPFISRDLSGCYLLGVYIIFSILEAYLHRKVQSQFGDLRKDNVGA